MKINRETIYTKIGPVAMRILAVCLVALTLVSVFMHGWPTSPPSIQTLVVLGHSLVVCIIGLVLARGQWALVFEFWFDVGLAPSVIIATLDWAVLPLWLCGIFVVVVMTFWMAGIRKLREAQRMNPA